MTFASCRLSIPTAEVTFIMIVGIIMPWGEVASCTSYDGNMDLLGLVDFRSE